MESGAQGDVRSPDGEITLLYEANIDVPILPVALEQNHPNPFNPNTAIVFYLPEAANVTLAVYDVTGSLVKTLASGPLNAGPHTREWHATDESGRSVVSGVYLYRLIVGKEVLTRKMLLLK